MKIKEYIFPLILLIVLISCEKFEVGNEFLEKPPSVDVTSDTVFSSATYARRFLFGAYATLPYGLNTDWSDKGNKLGMDILESLSDLNQSYLTWGGVMQLYYSGQYNAATENSNTNTKYSFLKEGSWQGIRASYIFIQNVDKVPDMDENEKKQLIAEARMIVAIHYTDMFRHFGGLPWVNKAFAVGESIELPRLTAEATLDSIVNLIEKAEVDLPWTISELNNWDGRFTKASAKGLKARVLLFSASPLFNDQTPYLEGEASQKNMSWYGGYDANLWKRAADAAQDLITAVETQGGYGLVKTGNPRLDFRNGYYNRGNGELLISTRVRYKAPGYWDGNYYFFQSAGGYGTGCPTQEYVDMFGMANGLPISDPASGYNPANPYVNRDPRLYETVLVNGDTYQGRTAELWIGGRERKTITATAGATGYQLTKFLWDKNSQVNTVIQWPYLRLPEIYLSYAEAANEVNNGPTTEAYRCVNILRNRVGLGNLKAGLSKDQFREAVLNERACEFGFEESRWFDLVRWKKEADFKKVLHGMDITKTGNVLTYKVFNLPARYWKSNWSPKWYLSAFPPNEINKKYGLVQNPGWE